MLTDPEYILNQISENITDIYPEMTIQSLLEIQTFSDFTKKREKIRVSDDRNLSCVQYEMSMFEEDELNLLENEYKSYICFNSIVKKMNL